MTTYSFGPFVLDAGSFRLSREGKPLDVSPRLLDLLLYLLTRPSALATKDELLNAIWPDVSVTDNSLAQAISDLRHILGDDAARPAYVQTVARRGYRFVGEVRSSSSDPTAETDAARAPRSVPVEAFHRPRIGVRETSNLEAFRALSEGRLRLESLDPTLAEDAIRDFSRSIELDPRYAMPYVGLANAYWLQYEAGRLSPQPDTAILARALDCAQRAIALDHELAEAHATLALIQATAEDPVAASRSARRAIALEPHNWRHHFRHGFATWGDERLQALAQSLDLHPEFPFAFFLLAMVHVARNRPDEAERALREGIALQEQHGWTAGRFPPNGLHWLLGLERLSCGDRDGAAMSFSRELETCTTSRLYGMQVAVSVYDAIGFSALTCGAHAEAETAFRKGLALGPAQSRLRLGLKEAVSQGRGDGASDQDDSDILASTVEDALPSSRFSAAMVRAIAHALRGHAEQSAEILEDALSTAPAGPFGWTIPVDPALAAVRQHPAFQRVLDQLARRAE